MTRILIADDHPMVRDALRSAVLYSCQATDVMEADRLDSVMQALEERGDLDLVLLDVNMPGMNGLGGLRTLRQRFPATPVVVVSAHEERRWVREAMERGAAGFIPKSTPRDAIAAVTAQQLGVLELLGTGKLNKETAYDLSNTATTVKAHVSAILQKLKVYSRTQAVVIANRVLADRR